MNLNIYMLSISSIDKAPILELSGEIPLTFIFTITPTSSMTKTEISVWHTSGPFNRNIGENLWNDFQQH